MNKVMIERWNEKVKPEDTVYHLGDFSMSMRGLDYIVHSLNGTKVLIKGNHDACFPTHKSFRKGLVTDKDYIKFGFSAIELEMIIELPLKGRSAVVKLNHLPYAPEDGEEADRRYMQFRPKDEKNLLLCGHVHTSFKFNKVRRMINVGVDLNNYYPYSVDDIDKIVTENNFDI
jgi:calcineurin-like phosphoesterase family protein